MTIGIFSMRCRGGTGGGGTGLRVAKPVGIHHRGHPQEAGGPEPCPALPVLRGRVKPRRC